MPRKAKKQETIGERVQRLRLAVDGSPSPEELLRMTGRHGLSARTIRSVESGESNDPRLSTLRTLAAVLAVSVAELIGEK